MAVGGLLALVGAWLACGDAGAPTPPDEEPSAPVAEEAPMPVEPVAPSPPAPPPEPELVPEPSPPPSAKAEPQPPPALAPEPAPAPAADATPGLSLDELAERIKATPAIGVFTKLTLKNDIDDLLAAMAGYHERGKGELSGLHQRYESLVLKLLTLLEDKEPDLARSLARSRGDIWNLLADPVRFAELPT